MNYKAEVKCQQGCYWWLDKDAFDQLAIKEISYTADSDDEALYIAALISYAAYDENMMASGKVSPVKISRYELQFMDCHFGAMNLECLMDNPVKYINANKIRISRLSPYILNIYKINEVNGLPQKVLIWQNECVKPEFVFPKQDVYTAWYAEWQDLQNAKLIPQLSIRYCAPAVEQAPIGAAFKCLYDYYHGKFTFSKNEPVRFVKMLYCETYDTLGWIYRNRTQNLSDCGPYRLFLAVIENSDHNIIWTNSHIPTAKLSIPDRSGLFENS